LVADSHDILAGWRNHFSQPLNVHGINDVRQTDRHTADPLVPEPSAFEVETVIEKLKRKISPYIVTMPVKFITAGRSKIPSEIHKLIILFRIRSNCLRSGRSRSFYLFVRRVTEQE